MKSLNSKKELPLFPFDDDNIKKINVDKMNNIT